MRKRKRTVAVAVLLLAVWLATGWLWAGGAEARRTQTAKLEGVLARDTTIGGPEVTVRVRGMVMVPGKITLTVLPGSLVEFYPGGGLTVSGHLSMGGTGDAPIVLTALDRRRAWEGVAVNAGTAELSWCVVTLAKVGLAHNGKATVRSSAFVRNVTGMALNGGSITVDASIVGDSVGDGVVGGGGSQKLTGSTITGSGGLGYLGTSKGFPVMDLCAITHNRGGGLKGENMFDRGSPVVTNSNIFGNGRYDIWLQRGDSFKFTNVHVGEASSAKLLKTPDALVPNISDARRTKKADAGIVIIENVAAKPVPDAGVAREVLELASKYRSQKKE